eukprot:CAMPEP_0181339546 /NCGR_PEP_ID=MMETSP1101-20121128/29318_1 /TAXON_ID=46948 /ORGANISM="Rhodomonas abbreviata, Strain Caron Lab Isolate" /LENGTH=153 /DNA_ID=CAMNT_0023450531 /DNA_START=1 /DNA_END=462 /DNA_ORIENTATION=+
MAAGMESSLLGRRPAMASRLLAPAIVSSLVAVACLAVVLLSSREQTARPVALVERQFDVGEDWFSAVESPHKTYEWPWLKDGKFYHQSKVLAYGPEEHWDYMTGWRGYRRTPYDEYGDHGYDVDQRPAEDCYTNDGDDCFREVFDPSTGFLPA